jgi:hypothetical protein
MPAKQPTRVGHKRRRDAYKKPHYQHSNLKYNNSLKKGGVGCLVFIILLIISLLAIYGN